MSSKNKKMRKRLAELCGEGCFFERANVAQRIEQMGRYKNI